MQQIKTLFAILMVGGLALFLFFIGLGAMLVLFVAMALTGLFVKPQTRKQMHSRWRARWTKRRQTRQSAAQTSTPDQSTVIEGQYRVVEPH